MTVSLLHEIYQHPPNPHAIYIYNIKTNTKQVIIMIKKEKALEHAERIGTFSFFLGITLAVLAGLPGVIPIASRHMAILILTMLGLIVGFLNLKDDDIKGFLIATIALLIANVSYNNGLVTIPIIGAYIKNILNYVAIFVSPAAIVVALQEIFNLAHTKHSR